MRRSSIIFAVTVIVFAAAALPAEATPPAPVTFQADPTPVAIFSAGGGVTGIAEGDFTASGTISDTGQVHDEFRIVDGTLHILRWLTGRLGTITMRIEARFVLVTATSETVEGRWAIIAGTGAYTALHGTGSFTATVDPTTHTVAETLTGVAHLD
jgi:hypothetical protein